MGTPLDQGGNAATKRDSASAIADVIGALMAERDRYREALEGIAADTQRTVAGLQGWARAVLEAERDA